MVRENQIKNLDCITRVKLSWLGYYVKTFSLSHRVCFLLTCVLCLSTKSKAPVPNAARNAGTCLAFFSWWFPGKLHSLKLTQVCDQKMTLLILCNLEEFQSENDLLQGIINLSPEKPCWLRPPAQTQTYTTQKTINSYLPDWSGERCRAHAHPLPAQGKSRELEC